MGDYSIVKAQLPVLGLGGHNLLVLLDPDGNVVAELDGEAADANGNSKPIGYLPSDRLLVNEHIGGKEGFYSPDLDKTTIASGDQKTIMNFWNAAKAARDQINRLSLQYPAFGFGNNSNSVASTLIAAMGLNDAPIPGLPRLTPGAGSILLEPEAIQNILRQYNIKAPPSEVVPDASSAPQSGSPPARAPQQLSPSLPVPAAKGPTSLGGPDGPTLLVPPVGPTSPRVAPSPPAPAPGRRSDIPPDVAPTSAQATPTAWPFLSADPVLEKHFNGRPNLPQATAQFQLPLTDPNALASPLPDTASGDNTPSLVRRLVNLSAPARPDAPSLAPDSQNPFDNGNASFGAVASSAVDAPSSQPLLGIVSGKPMPDYPVWPSIFQTKDQPSNDQSAGDVNELVQRWLHLANA